MGNITAPQNEVLFFFTSVGQRVRTIPDQDFIQQPQLLAHPDLIKDILKTNIRDSNHI